jgi:hypothetical protein
MPNHVAGTRIVRTTRRSLVLCVLYVVSIGGAGCGYSLAGRGSFLPAYIQTIGVPTFGNRTPVFNLETQLTEKVRSEFIGRGKYKILPDAEGVDALLTGNVVGVVATPVSLNLNGLATRYMLTLNASVELRDVKQNEVIWQNPGLLFRQEYDIETGGESLDPSAFFGQDANALDRMTTDFARTIVSAILEAF